MNRKRINKMLEQALICAFPLLMLLLFSPMDIWAGNKTQFAFNWGDFFWIYLIAFVIIEIASTIILTFIPNRITEILDSLIVIFSITSYIQVMFLNVQLSADDGGKMPWDKLHGLMIKNGFIWIIVVALLLFLIFKFDLIKKKIHIYLSAFLTLIQFVALISIILTNLSQAGFVKETYIFGEENQFEVAEGNNVIVFVLDTFGSAQLDMALEQDSTCLDGMKDFTYYNNADSGYFRTLPSMTHLLTGKEYDPNMTVGNWSAYAWNDDSTWNYYNTLHDNEYNCYLYSDTMYYTYVSGTNLAGKFDNIVKGDVRQVHREWLISKLTKMTLYKYCPYVLKPYFEVISNELDTIVVASGEEACVTNMARFKNKLEELNLSIGEDKNALIVQHLYGTHAVREINENAEVVPENETDFSKCARGVLKIIYEYFDKLKEIDKYDDTTIIIVADHGEWELEDRMDPQIIFFVKTAGETHDEVQINSSPVCNCDIMPTVYDVIGLDYSNYGASINDWNESSRRERTIFILNDDTLQGWTYSTKDELLEKVENDPEIYIETDEY